MSSELKIKVDDYIKISRKYFKSGDVDYLDSLFAKGMVIKEINKNVYNLLTNVVYFYINDITYKQIYHVIDYLCKTNLENEDEI